MARIVVGWFAFLGVCSFQNCVWSQDALGDAPNRHREVVFNRDIRPILSEYCFACHGPDQHARQAELRLDDRQAAIDAGAFVPGDATASALMERILSDDPDMVMPPPKSNKVLRPEEKERLRAWIESGAEYQAHWAFIPVPKNVPLPRAGDDSAWPRNAIDRFVLQGLEGSGVTPAPETTRDTWLRRVTMDLTGLPPTLEELDAFLADRSPNAYDRVVDRLLNSTAYAERMTNEWLDVARYADTFGYQADRQMHVWPWRDWCIRAFQANLPYDQFIVAQTAGDLVPNATMDQRIATAFNRLHRQTNEGGSIEAEFRVAYVADRVVTNGTAFLGLTLECARCHDHKFDPIAQSEFYSLAAFFANIDEHGLYSHFTETAPTPTQLLYKNDEQSRHAELLSAIDRQEAVVQQARAVAEASFAPQDSPLMPAVEPQHKFTFEDVTDTGDHRPVEGRVGKGIQFGGDVAYVCQDAGAFDRTTPFTIGLWLKPADHAARRVVFHRSVAAEDAAFRGYSLVVDQGLPTFSLIHFWPGNAIQVQDPVALPIGEWTHITICYDGSSCASGIRIYRNGRRVELDVTRDQLTRDSTYRGEWGDSGGAQLSLGARFRDVGFSGGAVDEVAVFDRALTSIEVSALVDDATRELVGRDVAAQKEHYVYRSSDVYRLADAELQRLRREENTFVSTVPQLMVLRDAVIPRETRLLRRGAYDAPGDVVQPDVPTEIFPFPSEYPRNRLGLAQWMVDDRNPLVSRVAVNRLWKIFFGRGIVASVGDFGSQGQPPSHPELLDWLARHFMDHGWNVHDLCKMIVLSSTYRQSSRVEDMSLAQSDPDNKLLARGPRHRWSAEQLRDNALSVSGLLVRTIGGPSVYPYQPTGLWEESGTGQTYHTSTGEGLYRRSLYTFWRRTSPPPSMTTFDATSREVCTASRERTGTPLQALVLQNDPQYVEAARVLAERLIREFPEQVESRVSKAYRLVTSREATAEQLQIINQLYAEQLAYYQSHTEAARELLGVGATPRDVAINDSDHAATTIVIQTMLNFDGCVVKR